MSEKIINIPLVTIYIPTYNRVELLKRAVDSVLKQSYKNIELIIVDDCSPDNTIQFLKELAKKDSRIKYFQNNKNSGACVSRNKAIMEAKGEFITGLDDDDYFLPNRINDFVNYWIENVDDSSNVVCLFSNYYLLNTSFRMKSIKTKNIVTKKDLLSGNWIGNQIFTKTDFLKNILFDENLKMWQDLDCWYRLLGENKIALNIDKITSVVDISHPHERITQNKVENLYITFKYFGNKYNLDTKSKAILQTNLYNYENIQLTWNTLIKLIRSHRNYLASKILIKKYTKQVIGK